MTDWRTDAACRGMNPAIFHPDRGDADGIRQALEVCAGCPVAQQCLTWALDTNQKQGVWGGTTGRDRRELRRTWVRTVPCQRCGVRLETGAHIDPKYCETCRRKRRSEVCAEHSRTASYDPKRCPVCTCEFTGGRDCCSPICARVYRRRQVAS